MIKDKIREQRTHLANFRRAMRLVWQAAPLLTLAVLILVVLQSAAGVSQLYITKRLFDTVVAGLQAPTDGTFRIVVTWVALGAGSAWLVAALRAVLLYVNEVQAAHVSESIQHLIAAKSIRVDLAYYENAAFFDTLHQAQLEAPFRPARIITALTDIVQSCVSLAAVGVVLYFSFSFPVLAGVVALLCFGAVVRIRNVRLLYALRKRSSPTERELNYFTWLLSSSAAAKELRVFRVGEALIRRTAGLRGKVRTARMKISGQRMFGDIATQLAVALGTFFAVLHLARQAFLSAISVGELIMNVQALQRGGALMQQLTGGVSHLYEHGIFLRRFFEFLALENKITDPDIPRIFPTPIESGIEFRNVTFRYPSAKEPTLRGVSFRIRRGQTVALVGENGAGKSTLLKLLCRLYEPSSGSILVDGVDLRSFSRDDLWRNIAPLFQDFVQYQATVRDNIVFDAARQGMTDASILHAAKQAGAHDLVMEFPKQCDQVLGNMFEGGVELSGGQWQKLALSRAFIRDAQIVLLDEPTSALDVTAEHEFFSRFRELARGKMSLVVSHRLSTVRMANTILYLENGRITEMGEHDDLVAQNGAYAQLFALQARHYA